MDTIEGLRAELLRVRGSLAEAREENRQLKRTLVPAGWIWYGDLQPSAIDRVILNALFTATGPVSAAQLRQSADIALGRPEAGSKMSIQVRMVQLRRKLAALEPPIAIDTIRGVGFWLDAENRARLAARRGIPPGGGA